MKEWVKYLLVCILGIILGASINMGVMYYMGIFNNTFEENNLQEENSNIKEDDNTPEEKIKKIYQDKDYVYDIKYDYVFSNKMKNNEISSSNISFGSLEFPTNITQENIDAFKIPFINIDNKDVEKINNELKDLYLKYAKFLNNNRLCEESDEDYDQNCEYYNLTYKTFINEELNTLTILILDYSGDTSVPVHHLLGYVIDLESGAILNNMEIAKRKNLSLEKLKEKTIMAINDYFKTDDSYSQEETIKYYEKNIKNLNNQYQEDKENGGLIYYIDNAGKINIISSLVDENAQIIYEFYVFTIGD